eukprot:2513521-Pyramimonas_sp.AAC.1
MRRTTRTRRRRRRRKAGGGGKANDSASRHPQDNKKHAEKVSKTKRQLKESKEKDKAKVHAFIGSRKNKGKVLDEKCRLKLVRQMVTKQLKKERKLKDQAKRIEETPTTAPPEDDDANEKNFLDFLCETESFLMKVPCGIPGEGI